METVKNFLVGLLITTAALLVLTLGFMLWPVFLGIGSFLIFVVIIVFAVLLAFYIIVLIGYVVRKGLSVSGKKIR
jgi:hypothetical protein